jgi:hypothetical protein
MHCRALANGAGEHVTPLRTEFRAADFEELVRSLKAEIGARVRPLIGNWPSNEIERLLDQMARIKLKYDGIDVATGRASERGAPPPD